MRLHWLMVFSCLWFPIIVQFSDGSLVWYRYPAHVPLDSLPGPVVANRLQPLTYEDPEAEEWFDKMIIHKKDMARSGGQYDQSYQQSQPRALRFG
ncbi:hypothetical protein P879_01651 [Paragonimus westermani]|uniref:Uncharacterized protein n=1 Tax=Paragonimus westermani TaxID=34504 RepID=A0A8T0DTF7_9TREM|nr:hypothetical protein P879_01651 [Paragonimus westermani]